MGKKRVKTESTRRDTRVDSVPDKHEPSCSDHRHGGKNRMIAFFSVVTAVVSVLTYRQFIHSRDLSPLAHHLLTTRISYEEILEENSRVSANANHRNFTNPVLVYVTPWNSAGYDIAKRFNSKFTHISPVWYQLKSVDTELVLEGRHNVDNGWLSELRSRGSAKVLPRVAVEVLPQDLMKKKKQRDKAIDLIVTECKDMDYDGIVLESWSIWAAYGVVQDSSLRKTALQFVKQLGEALQKTSSHRNGERLQLVYVIGPPHSNKLQPHDFGPQDLQFLSESVDGFSLMTYDYSNAYNPGPNAPLKWVHDTLALFLGKGSKGLANKIFVGINFYGNDFIMEGGGGKAILGRDYLTLLDQYKPRIEWHHEFAENFFMYFDKISPHVVFYPTPMSISRRLEEARSWGAGISIWEIGQGLDYFYDLL